jgi:hypothetical protein
MGMILGALLTIAGVYSIDTWSTASATAGSAAVANRTMVNWDVVEMNWNQFKTRAHDGWDKLAARIER